MNAHLYPLPGRLRGLCERRKVTFTLHQKHTHTHLCYCRYEDSLPIIHPSGSHPKLNPHPRPPRAQPKPNSSLSEPAKTPPTYHKCSHFANETCILVLATQPVPEQTNTGLQLHQLRAPLHKVRARLGKGRASRQPAPQTEGHPSSIRISRQSRILICVRVCEKTVFYCNKIRLVIHFFDPLVAHKRSQPERKLAD